MTAVDKIIEEAGSANKRIEALSGFCNNGGIVLYGAGLTGRTILKKLQERNIQPLFIADDTPAKQGTNMEGVAIKPLSSTAEIQQPYALIVTMMNPDMNFSSLKTQLHAKGIEHVFSFLELSFLFPADLLPYFHFDVKENLLKDRADINSSFALFTEAQSQEIFLNNLKFRLSLDFDCIKTGDKDEYFPAGVTNIPDESVFFDCGAFDGDTVKSFLARKKNFDQVFAFEPDPANFNKLLLFGAGLEKAVSEKVHVFNHGLGAAHGFLRFNSLNNMASAISDDGNVVIQTMGLDEFFYPMLKDYTGRIFIKMDIEGAEPQALIGCKKLISEKNASLAISIYHNPNDLWHIPLYIHSINSNYRFLLRQHGNDSMDLVLYAIPE